MTLEKDVEEFIESHMWLIDKDTPDAWFKFYEEFEYKYEEELAGKVSAALLDAGVDPCSTIGAVPRRFLLDQEQIESYSIPKNCTFIGARAFEGTGITHFNIPPTVTSFDYSCFCATLIEQFVVPDTVKEIDNAVFYGCTNLREIDLGQITSIGEYVFDLCINLEVVKLPSSLIYVDINTLFKHCKKLHVIEYKGTKEQFISQTDCNLTNIKIICIDGVIEQ